MSSELAAAKNVSESPEKLIEIGRAYLSQGEIYKAQIAFALAVITVPENKAYKAFFQQSVAGYSAGQFHDILKQAIFLCLEESDLMHLPMFFTWYSTLMLDPAHASLRNLLVHKDYESFVQNFSLTDFFSILNSDFLRKGLEKLLIKNHDFERVLTYIRRYALLQANEKERLDAAPFLISFAAQCFFNEYIFYISEEEQRALDQIHNSSRPLAAIDIILLACYGSLHASAHALEWAELLLQSGHSVDELIRLQITEPLEEKALKTQIRSFGGIKDKISQAVQAQYEEHPYPRWISCGGIIRSAEEKNLSAGKKILVAGCGTGQQACMVSIRFPAAEITAIDLSRSSLAYARRKAQNMNRTNIDFLHGDILEAAALDRKFDYIACGGVLHHMESPKAGFVSLKNILAPDGVMRIALYSDLARKDIVEVQKWVAEKNIPSTLEGMRNFRKIFVEGAYKEIFTGALPFFDAFSASECRDLFFHVQEHRFTWLDLKEIFEDLRLDLLMVSLDVQDVRHKYALLFPGDPKALNLENWHRFEQQNPNSFINMYKFYIAHKARYEQGQIPQWLR